MKEEVYVVVRKDAAVGAEFRDFGTVSATREGAQIRARETGNNAAWREGNPVVRVGRFMLEEVNEQGANR